MRPDISDERTRINTVSLVVIAVVAAGIALMFARSVLVPFVLAVFIFLLVSPILDFGVIRLKLPRGVAVLITLLIVLIILSVLFLFASQAIQTIIDTAGRYSEKFNELLKQITEKLEPLGSESQESKIVTVLKQQIIGIGNALQKQIPGLVTNTFGTVLGMVTGLFLVSIFVIFLLIGRNPYSVRKGIYGDIDRQVRRYIAIKTGASVVTGLLVWAILALFGLELASVFGLFAFLLNFIPSIGSVIATLLPVPIAVAQFDSPWRILFVLLIPGTVQIFIGNGIEPKLLGKGLHLHPVTILLALAFWGLLWGIVGMFLAVPMTAVIRIVLLQFRTLRPVGRLMAGEFGEDETPSQDQQN
jgi:AI-2 transport protein TqsA